MDTIQLNNGITMPQQGLGVFQVTDQSVCKESVLTALQTGYRLIDTAACYGNERAVGEAVRESGIAREELFLTSKVWIQDAGYDRTMRSFEKNLENLGTDYLDLYLIHMPYGDYHGSWRTMEELLWFVNQHLANTGRGNFEGTEVKVIFDRDVLINETEVINNCKNSVGILSDETIVKMHPWVSDPEQELQRIKDEKEEAMADPYQAAFMKNRQNGGDGSGNPVTGQDGGDGNAQE